MRPLLPGGQRCGVLVTSRARLAGLEGAANVEPGLFSLAEAVQLLQRVAGAKLAAKPHWSAAELADRLAD